MWPRYPSKFRSSKFGNVETFYKNTLFRSKLEANYAAWLDSEKRKGRIKDWKYEVAIPLHAKGGKKVGEYQCDFEITFTDNHKEWHECKGRWTDLARWKVKHCRLEYPNRVLRIIK